MIIPARRKPGFLFICLTVCLVMLFGSDLNTFSEASACTYVPPQTPTRTPGPGNCLYFDGVDNYVSIPDNPSLALSNDLSVECWVRPDVVSGTQTIIGKGTDGSGDKPLTLQLNGAGAQVSYTTINGTVAYTMTDGGANDGLGAINFTLSTCKWYHLAVTYDQANTTLTLYVNGVAAASDSAAPPPDTNSLALAIGQSGNNSNYFKGAIDEVRIFKDYAFGATVLRDWMCKKAANAHPGWNHLSLYYRFDENGSDTTVYDYGALHNNGTASPGFALASDRVCSSAPVGDDSVHDYNGTNPVDFTAALSYPYEYGTNPDINEVTVTGDGGTWSNAGLQLYRVDDYSNNTDPPFAYGTGYVLDPLRYWGVFVANGTALTYQLVYNYTRHQGISLVDESTLKLAKREGNCATPWADSGATLNTTDNTLTITGQAGTEFILAGDINATDSLVVKLLLFKAVESQAKNVVTVQWETATETNTLGFNVWRSESKDGAYAKLNDDLIQSKGGNTWGAVYIYDDYDIAPDKTSYYKLEEIEDGEVHNFYGPVSSDGSIVIDCDDDGTTISCFISTLAGR